MVRARLERDRTGWRNVEGRPVARLLQAERHTAADVGRVGRRGGVDELSGRHVFIHRGGDRARGDRGRDLVNVRDRERHLLLDRVADRVGDDHGERVGLLRLEVGIEVEIHLAEIGVDEEELVVADFLERKRQVTDVGATVVRGRHRVDQLRGAAVLGQRDGTGRRDDRRVGVVARHRKRDRQLRGVAGSVGGDDREGIRPLDREARVCGQRDHARRRVEGERRCIRARERKREAVADVVVVTGGGGVHRLAGAAARYDAGGGCRRDDRRRVIYVDDRQRVGRGHRHASDHGGIARGERDRVTRLRFIVENGARLQVEEHAARNLEEFRIGAADRDRVAAQGIVRHHDVGHLDPRGGGRVLVDRRNDVGERNSRRSFVDVRHGDGDRLRGGEAAVADLHGHVVDVVSAHIGRRFEVRRDGERERAARGDREPCRVGAADDRVGERGSGVHVGRGRRLSGQLVLGNAHGRAGGEHRRFVDVRDRDGDRLGGGERAVRYLDDDVVDIVGTRIGRVLEVRRRQERQSTRAGVDREETRVGAPGDRVGQRRAFHIGADNCGDGGRVLGHVHRRRSAAAIGRDRRGSRVDPVTGVVGHSRVDERGGGAGRIGDRATARVGQTAGRDRDAVGVGVAGLDRVGEHERRRAGA